MAAFPLWGLLAGLGLGGVKHVASDLPREARQKKLAGEVTRYSPWTNLKADPIQHADLFGSLFQTGLTGATMQQGIENNETWKNWMDRGAASSAGIDPTEAVDIPTNMPSRPVATTSTWNSVGRAPASIFGRSKKSLAWGY